MDPAGTAAAGSGDAGAAGSGFQFSVSGSQFSVFCAVNSFLEIYLRSLAGTRATVVGIGNESGIPPSPRSIGIIGLERKCDLIYGAQSLTGKILMSKNLQAKILRAEDQNGTCEYLRTVAASTMITQFIFGRKVRCHKGAVEE